ncbi:MAG: glycogen debranching enzyme GlgX, partial [Bacteroidota bacterium]
IQGAKLGDILWISPTGEEMTSDNWNDSNQRALGMLLNGEAMEEYDEKGRRIEDDIFLILLNSYWEPVQFTLPGLAEMTRWELILDTTSASTQFDDHMNGCDIYQVDSRTLSVFRMKAGQANQQEDGRKRMSILQQVRRLLAGIQE